MKHCEHCGKAFIPKTYRAKYCKDSCRVMACRKRDKSKKIAPLEAQVLLKSMQSLAEKMENMMSGVGFRLNPAVSPAIQGSAHQSGHAPANRPKSAQEWISEKREIMDEEEYRKWLVLLEADPYLTSKQKTIIKSS